MSPPKLTAFASGLGRPPPATSWKIAGIASAAAASISISDCTAGRRAVERLALALEAADQHRGAHDEQDVAEDRADQRGLDDLLEALRAARRGR